MTNNLLPVLVTTNAVACECGEEECFFCEPFAGLTDEEAYDLFYSCPACDALASEPHFEDCRIAGRYGLWAG